MTTRITKHPEFITREAYVALLESLGLDPSKVFKMSFSADLIYAEVLADPEDPEVRLFEQGEIPRKPVYIEIVD